MSQFSHSAWRCADALRIAPVLVAWACALQLAGLGLFPGGALLRADEKLAAGESVAEEGEDPFDARDRDDLEASDARPRWVSSPETSRLRPSLALKRTSTPPRIDGRLEDLAWRDAARSDRIWQYVPETDVPISERTEFRVTYDDDALYIAVWCDDREPEKIRARVMDRDGRLFQDDYITIVVDPFHDLRNGYLFQVNPTGARRDATITGNANFNDEWNGIWSAAATIDEDGWKLEMALPFSTVGFDPNSDTWGFNLTRSIRRLTERGRWSGAQPEIRSYTVSEAGTLTGLRNVRRDLGLKVDPYSLLRYRSDRAGGSDDVENEFGFDARYRLTSNLTASLSYNTDFAEAEVDTRRVNLSRFPLFFPEKRQFFLEDSGIFQFGLLEDGEQTSSGSALVPFFSRRIGLSDDGEVVPIRVAGKVTGRIGDYNIGVLNAVLEDQDELSEQNAFVARVSRNVFEQSSVGMITTLGNPNSEDENVLVGPDFQYRTSRFLGDNILQASVFGLGTLSEGEGGHVEPAYGAAVGLPNDQYVISAEYIEIGEDFNPALGFVPRRGIRSYETEVSWRPRPRSLPSIRQVRFMYETDHVTDLSDRLESWQHEVTPLYVIFESSDELSFDIEYKFDQPDEDFEISDGVVIPSDGYYWTEYDLEFESSSRRLLRVDFKYTWGHFYGGRRERYTGEVWFLPWRYFNLAMTYSLNHVDLPEGDFETRVSGVQARVNFLPDMTWTHFVQYDNVSELVGYNSRFQWEFQPGAWFFLVANQNYERDNGGVQLLASELTTKVGLAWSF